MKMIDLHCHILYDIDDGAKQKRIPPRCFTRRYKTK